MPTLEMMDATLREARWLRLWAKGRPDRLVAIVAMASKAAILARRDAAREGYELTEADADALDCAAALVGDTILMESAS